MNPRIEQVRDWLKDYASRILDAAAAHIDADGKRVGEAVAAAEETAHRILEYVHGAFVPPAASEQVADHIGNSLVNVNVPDRPE